MENSPSSIALTKAMVNPTSFATLTSGMHVDYVEKKAAATAIPLSDATLKVKPGAKGPPAKHLFPSSVTPIVTPKNVTVKPVATVVSAAVGKRHASVSPQANISTAVPLNKSDYPVLTSPTSGRTASRPPAKKKGNPFQALVAGLMDD